MCTLPPTFLKTCIPTPCVLSNMHFSPFVNFFINYKESYHTFKVSCCTFKKVQGVNLHITQNSGEYSTLILGKMHIRENSGSQDACFQNIGGQSTDGL